MDNIPEGFCQCGCGEKLDLAPYSFAARGWVRGEPKRFIRGHNARKVRTYTIEDRGYSTPCHIWAHATDRDGYGVTSENGRSVRAHRWYWEQAHGPLPPFPTAHLHHLCEVTTCVNVSHLRLLTPKQHRRIPTATSRLLTHDGQTLTVVEWAERVGLRHQVLRDRLRRGWAIERALTQPRRDYPR